MHHLSLRYIALHGWILSVRCLLFSNGVCSTSLSIVRMLIRYKEAWICYFKASVFTIQYIQQSTPMRISDPIRNATFM